MINIKGDVFTNEVRDIVSDFVSAMQDVVHRHGYERLFSLLAELRRIDYSISTVLDLSILHFLKEELEKLSVGGYDE